MRAWIAVCLMACGAAQAAEEASFVNEGVIPAPVDEVWKVFSTSEGYKTLTPTDDGTHLRVASYGYGSDEESLAMRRFFEAGNQQTIETLRRHFGAPAP